MHAFFVLAIILLLLYSSPFRSLVAAAASLLALGVLFLVALDHASKPAAAPKLEPPVPLTTLPNSPQSPPDLLASESGQRSAPSTNSAPPTEITPITTDDIQLTHLTLHPGPWTDAFELSGRIRNASASHPVNQVVVRLRLQDCPASPAAETLPWRIPQQDAVVTGCDTVLDRDLTISVTIPASQARDFSTTFGAADPIHPQGAVVWHVDLLSVS